MKYILAENLATQTVITSEGDVAFVDGVASEFTEKQADYFTDKGGYLLSDTKEFPEDQPEEEIVEADKAPKLPVLQDKLAEIIVFAKEHKVNLEGISLRAKKPLLEAIYTHFEG